MSTAVAAPPPTPGPAAMSEGARLVNTFIAPSKIFTDLRRSAAWWGPFLVLAVVSWIFVYIVDNKVGFRKVVDNQIQMSPKGAERLERLPADQRARAMDQQVTITKYISWGFPAFLAIWYGIIALILFATFKLALSAPVSLWQSLGIVWYSALPQVIKSLLAMLTLMAGASADSFTFQNPVATNPGYFMNRADAPFLYGVATSLDIFVIWTLILAGIGFACVAHLKRSTSMAVVFGWYAIFVIGGSALGAALN
jgi:Yip1-like protein